MSAPSARQVTVCASPKGGQGCTTIAAVLAVLAAQRNQPALLLDTRGDAAPTLGVSDPAPASTFADAIANVVEPCDCLRVASVAGDRIDSDAISAISELVAAGYRVIVRGHDRALMLSPSLLKVHWLASGFELRTRLEPFDPHDETIEEGLQTPRRRRASAGCVGCRAWPSYTDCASLESDVFGRPSR